MSQLVILPISKSAQLLFNEFHCIHSFANDTISTTGEIQHYLLYMCKAINSVCKPCIPVEHVLH